MRQPTTPISSSVKTQPSRSISGVPAARYLCIAMLLVATLGAAVAPAFAQDWKGRGRVRGTVVDKDGNAIKDARVSLSLNDQEGNGPEAIVTDKRGRWAYMGLSSGPYLVVVEADGFQSIETNTRVNEYASSATKPIDVSLRKLTDRETGAEQNRLMSWVEEGNRLLTEGKYAEARAKFEAVKAEVKDAEQKASFDLSIAGTYLEEGDTAQARRLLEGLLASAEPAEQVGILQMMARSYYVDENIDQSVGTLEKALALQPDDATSLRLIVDILVSAGREQDAEPYMQRLPEGEKVDADALLNLGISAYNDGDYDAALDKFNTVVESYPDNASAYYYLGLVYLGKEDTTAALSNFEKMLALEPEHPNAAEAQQFLEYLSTL